MEPKTHTVAFGRDSHWETYERLGLIQSEPAKGINIMMMKDGIERFGYSNFKYLSLGK